MRLDDAPDLLTVDQTAELLQVHRDTVYAAVRADELPHMRIRGHTIRIVKARLLEQLGLTNGDDPDAARVEAADEAASTATVTGLHDGR